MSKQLMINQQHHDALWTLGQGQVIRLAVHRNPRQLRVIDGSLWLTTQGRRDRPAEDIWLLPGEMMELPARSEWVVEARGAGRFQLLVPQPRSWPAAPWAQLLGWMRAFGAGVPRALRT